MSYIGTHQGTAAPVLLDSISVVNGQAAYTMQKDGVNYTPATTLVMQVSLNGIIQAPISSYTISGSTITFASALVTGDVIDYILVREPTTGTIAPVDGSITDSKIVSMAASKLTGALPALDGSALTGVGGGKVLQVVHDFHTTEATIAASAGTPKPTGLTATITPTDATSKILVTYSLTTGTNQTGGAYGAYHMVYHDIGQTGTDTAFSARFFGSRTGQYTNYQMTSIGGQILHDHNTTSAIDYTVYIDEANSATIYINTGGSGATNLDGASSITLMEIGA
tara:strand:+ start:1795 stop:2637 length:843 start_codon:yes stop_codon:yes gene_type:complete